MSNFDSLTDEEKKEVLKILNQISSNGNSTAYNTLLAADYDEIPVDIETFLREPKYLGRGLIDNEGRFTVFPYWVETLKKIYPHPLKPAKYNTLALTGCLSGDTKIKCLDGNSYTIKELFESEDFNDKWVYGYDLNKHTIIPDKIIAMKESGVQSIYRVTLDNGEYVDATLNHHFIARDGQVKSLSEFSVGDSLMPFNHDLTDSGYEQIYIPRADGRTDKICTHTQVSRHTNRYKKNTEVVHHKDFNKRNNNPENLVIWDKSYHIKYHANLSNWDNVNEIHRNPLDKRTIAWKENVGKASKRNWDNAPDRHKETSKRVSTMMFNGQAAKMAATVWEGPNSEINRENARQRCVQYNKSYWERNKHLIKDKQFYIDCLSKTYTLGQAIKLSNQPHTRFKYALKYYNIDITDFQRNKTISNHAFANTLNRLSKLSDDELRQSEKAQKFSEIYYDSWDEFKEAINLFNHKIVSIEYLKDEMTYDLETQYTHTFGLDCGIFIGNSIGIGKSFVAVLIGLYELYRMICLKDPYVYYGLQPIDKITFAVMNITLDASRGVAWDKMQQLLQSSDWFMSKGTVTGTVNEEWNPPKGIELIAGSLSRHIIGRAVFWCLDGDTEIATNLGDYKLSELVDKQIQVYNIDTNGNLCLSDYCTVKPTAIETEEYEIELEDGTIIKCTPSHRFMLSDGSYKEAQYLTEDDDILYFKPFGYVYKFTNTKTGKIYIGKREKSTFDEHYYGSGKLWKESFSNKEDIEREILYWGISRDDLNAKEKYYIKLFDSQNPDIGYNIHKGGQGGNSLNNTEEWSKLHRGINNGMYGKYHTEETKQKISKANTGRKYSEDVNKKKGRLGVKKPNGFGEKIRKVRVGKHLSNETKQKISTSLKGKLTGSIYNNGVNEKRIKEGDIIPEGYVKGRILKGKPSNKSPTKGKSWYNNGIKEILIENNPPEGYAKGRLKRRF